MANLPPPQIAEDLDRGAVETLIGGLADVVNAYADNRVSDKLPCEILNAIAVVASSVIVGVPVEQLPAERFFKLVLTRNIALAESLEAADG
jgi:hypothetical protein